MNWQCVSPAQSKAFDCSNCGEISRKVVNVNDMSIRKVKVVDTKFAVLDFHIAIHGRHLFPRDVFQMQVGQRLHRLGSLAVSVAAVRLDSARLLAQELWRRQ